MSLRAAMLAATILVTAQSFGADRSRQLRAEFMRSTPCPATGQVSGPCPGWHVDHREALICGGKDQLDNLQWLTVAEHREKTRVEVKLCRPRRGKQ